MSYQKCPVCEGSGISPVPGTYSGIPVCPTCIGSRIINTINGLPPSGIPIIDPMLSYARLDLEEKRYKDYARHAMKKRLADPECTLEDMYNDWVNEKNL